MGFLERLKRKPLDRIIGFNGGSLGDQLDGDVNAPRADLQQAALNQTPNRMSGIASTQSPQPTMADQYMATAQPAQPVENRPRQVNPFQQRLMQGRPRIADPVGFDVEHLRELEAKKDPRWERILNATAAGITSAAQGGAPIKPIPTRRERDIGVIGNRLGRDVALQNAQIKQQQSEMVDVDVPDGRGGVIHTQIPRSKAAATIQANEKLRQGQEKIDQSRTKPTYRNDAQGRVIKITPQPDGQDTVETVVNVTKTKVPHTVWADGKLKIWNDQTSRYDDAKDTNDKEITDELKTPVTVDINGKKFRVAPNTAAMATATGERFNITEDRAERSETRQEERDYRGRMAKAADLVGKIDGAKEAMRVAGLKLTKRPNDADAQEEFNGAKAYAIQAAKELGEGYGDLFETGIGTEGTPYYKRKSVQPPAINSSRRSSASQPQTDKPTKSLSAIRAAAESRNLDPDEAERRARKRTDITLVP